MRKAGVGMATELIVVTRGALDLLVETDVKVSLSLSSWTCSSPSSIAKDTPHKNSLVRKARTVT